MRARVAVIALVVVCLSALTLMSEEAKKTEKDWSMNATIIEACSCPMFCQCYFATSPAGHHEGHDTSHYCKFNNAYKVNRGSYGDTDLTGAKFWVAGDLGGEFADGEMDWAVLTFDPTVTPAQREGIAAALGKVYPVKWKSFTVAKDAAVEWTATKDSATARLDGGKAGEVVLMRGPGMTEEPVVIHNLRYWGVPRNDGFVLMPNKVEAYRVGDKAFEYKGTNGFMITFDINSKDAMAAGAGM